MILPLMPFFIGQLLTLVNKVLERTGTEHRAQAETVTAQSDPIEARSKQDVKTSRPSSFHSLSDFHPYEL